MKVGLNLWIWASPFDTGDLNLLAKVKSLEGEVVEFGLEDDARVDTKILRRPLADAGLVCSIIGLFKPERDLPSENATSRKRGMIMQNGLRYQCRGRSLNLYWISSWGGRRQTTVLKRATGLH
jgi:hypothetical protein